MSEDKKTEFTACFHCNDLDGYRPIEYRPGLRGELFLHSCGKVRTVCLGDNARATYDNVIICERIVKIIDIAPYIGKCDFELSMTGEFKVPAIENRIARLQSNGDLRARSQGWPYYRIRQNDIKYHAADTQPVPDGLEIRLYKRFDDGREQVSILGSHDIDWALNESAGYEVIGTSEGYQYAWEAKQ